MYILLSILFVAVSVNGAGEFSILHHPGNIIFKGHDPIKHSTLPEIYAAVLGLSSDHFSHWQGFYIENPFHLPEAVVTIAIDGLNSIGQVKGHHYPLLMNGDADESHVYKSLVRRIHHQFSTIKDAEPILIRIDLSKGLSDVNKYSLFDGINNDNLKYTAYKYLKFDEKADREFLQEMAILNEIAEKIEVGSKIKEDFISDVYWFHISSYNALVKLQDANSSKIQEAKQLLHESIIHLNNAFSKIYHDHVFVNVISSNDAMEMNDMNEHNMRIKRNVEKAEGKTNDQVLNKSDFNLATYYDKGFPVIFNITLWLCIILFFSLLAICFATADMDPGRDSIIYRMTSTRMKKDN